MSKKNFGISFLVLFVAAACIAAGSSGNRWYIGDGKPGSNKEILFRDGTATPPGIRYNDSAGTVEVSDGGGTWEAPSVDLQSAYDGGASITGTNTFSFTQSGTNNAFSITASSLTTGIGLDINMSTDDRARAIDTDGRIFATGDVSSQGYVGTTPIPGTSNLAAMLHTTNTSTTRGSGLISNIFSSGKDGLGIIPGAVVGNSQTNDPSASSNEGAVGVLGEAINLSNNAAGIGVMGISDLGIPGVFRHEQSANSNPVMVLKSLNGTVDGQTIFTITDNSYGSLDITNNGKIRTQDNTATSDIQVESGDASAGDSGDVVLETGSATGTRGKIRLVDGSEGTAGHVWTSTGTAGEGAWAAPSGGSTDNSIEGVDLSEDTDVTSGTCDITRVVNQVTVTCGAIVHVSSPSVFIQITGGVLPVWARPPVTSRNVYYMNGTRLAAIAANTDGSITLSYFNWAGGTSAVTSSLSPPSVTYRVN